MGKTSYSNRVTFVRSLLMKYKTQVTRVSSMRNVRYIICTKLKYAKIKQPLGVISLSREFTGYSTL